MANWKIVFQKVRFVGCIQFHIHANNVETRGRSWAQGFRTRNSTWIILSHRGNWVTGWTNSSNSSNRSFVIWSPNGRISNLISCSDPVRNLCHPVSVSCENCVIWRTWRPIWGCSSCIGVSNGIWISLWLGERLLMVTGKMRFGRERISGTSRFEELTCLITCIYIYIFATIDYQLSILPPMWHIASDNLTMFSLLPFEEYLKWPHHSRLIFPKTSTIVGLLYGSNVGSPGSPSIFAFDRLALEADNPLRKDVDTSAPYPSPATSGGIYAIRKVWNPILEKGRVTWWLIPLSKWVITPVIDGISRVNPLITGVITHLLSGMSHQVGMAPLNKWKDLIIGG